MISIEQIKSQQKNEFFKLLAWVGSQARLARQLGVEPQVVAGWVKRGRISAKMANLVDIKTMGKFKREDLRPDIEEWAED